MNAVTFVEEEKEEDIVTIDDILIYLDYQHFIQFCC